MSSWSAAAARWRLRACTSVGRRPLVRGEPIVRNSGSLEIGDDFVLNSTPLPSHLFVTGALRIGNRVRIGQGAAISCVADIEIADDVAIGAFVLLLDTNFHVAEDFSVNAKARPVRIGRGVRLGHRVVVLPGSTLRRGAVVKSGSVVSGEVAEDSVMEGNPARARLNAEEAQVTGAPEHAVPRLVMRVLGLRRLPRLHESPAEIPEWDSLGTLRLIVSVEETFGVSLSEDQAKSVRSIRQLVDYVEAAQRRDAEEGFFPA